MSYHVFFGFSSGLAKPLKVPLGTLKEIADHVEWVERTLDMKCPGGGSLWHWFNLRDACTRAEMETLCEVATKHNAFVRRLYEDLDTWSKTPVKGGESLTPSKAKKFWEALTEISVPVEKWTPEYYIGRMEHVYEVLRGRESEGATFDAKALTTEQAAAVINVFSTFLDDDDRRLDVPKGYDYLASSYDGGYDWCEKCGPMHPDDADCCRKRKCPIRAERG
jgi:hypothetical protein